MTVNELIEKLKKFNPDGNAEVSTHYSGNERGYNDDIIYLSLEEDRDGKLIVIIHTGEDY